MSQYEAPAHDLDAIKAIAEQYGFCLVRGVFDESELTALKDGMARVHENFGEQIPDILSCDPIKWIITDSRILKIARSLLGNELVYYPESNVNFEAGIGRYTLNPFNTLHCDARGMPGDRSQYWRSPTDQIFRGYRFAIYFQDYSRFSGGLKVGIGTHKGDPDAYLENGGVDQSSTFKIEYSPGEHVTYPDNHKQLYNVPARPGDVVVWNLRTVHAAGFRTLAHAPDKALHPTLETILADKAPSALRPVAGPRLGLFFDLAAPTEDVDLYIKSRVHGLTNHATSTFKHSRYDASDIDELTRSNGISLRYDHLLFYLLFQWIEAPKERPKIMPRVLALADRHREFSPHFSLFDRAAYDAVRGKNDSRALEIVFTGVSEQSALIGRAEKT